MDTGDRLPKDRHDQSIHGIDSREFHVIRQAVGRYSLEHELPHVGELTFVALKGNLQEPDADDGDE